MEQFADLFTQLDRTRKTSAKIAALATFFETASDADKMWAIALLSGRRPKRTVTTAQLRDWAASQANIPAWLFDESYTVVGDLAETIALLLPAPTTQHGGDLTHWITQLRALGALEEADRKSAILDAWAGFSPIQRLVFNKLITGGFRMGVSQRLMTRALAHTTGKPEAELAHRLMGAWSPDTTSFADLLLGDDPQADASRPYPFFLASGLEQPLEDLGAPEDWCAEYKWDGIRGQLIRRDGALFVWSRGEELVTDRYPEFATTLDFIPDGTVLDGELLAWGDGAPLSFNALQKRIGRKTVSKKLLGEVPVRLLAYDLLELDGEDLRARPLRERRSRLQTLIDTLPGDVPVGLSPALPFTSWEDLNTPRENARAAMAEGLMLKHLDSPYLDGRKRGHWWKWKLEPLVIDAVMIYAQSGHGRRATLFTDYTFAVWDGDALTPFTKAYSGLTDAEFAKITAWVRKNTLERFGPVRKVPPHHVFEIAFEGIQKSSRHKSGIALRFPRMRRWRQDKPAAEANTLADLHKMLEQYG